MHHYCGMKEVQCMGEVKNAVSNSVQNSLLPHLQIRYCYKIKSGLNSGNEANTHPLPLVRKSVDWHI